VATFDELRARAKTNWLLGMPRLENITDIIANFGDLNGEEKALEDELDRLYCGEYHLSDLGNAQRLVTLFGDEVRYSVKRRRWLIWTGARWEWDDEVLAVQRAKRVVQSMYESAGKQADDDGRRTLARWALQSESTSRLMAMVKSAESEASLHISDDAVDADPYLFNVENGTLDLRTGEFREHRREDFITAMAPVIWDPNATGEMWAKFLSDITAGDADLQRYLARAVGYSMTGNAREDIVFFIYGPGGNGKSTFLSTVSRMMGDGYAGTIPVHELIDNAKGGAGHRDAIASLAGTRMVLVAELPDRMKIDMGLIKALTGGDAISVSRKYEHSFTFRPTFKPWLYGNSKPRVPEIDDGTWRRVRLVPFLVQFRRGENEITDMEELLQAEMPAVLRWAVAGAVDWHAHGLTDPEAVSYATSEYREEEDVVGQFVEACCVADSGKRVSKAEMFDRYKRWCEDNGEVPVGTKTFTLRLRGHDIREDKSGSVRYWDGIGLSDKASGTDGTDGTGDSRKSIYEKNDKNFLESPVPNVPPVPPIPSVPRPTEPCHRCRSSSWWQRIDGEWMCAVCYPNRTRRSGDADS
jgi:putative DNA primase/helicase